MRFLLLHMQELVLFFYIHLQTELFVNEQWFLIFFRAELLFVLFLCANGEI